MTEWLQQTPVFTIVRMFGPKPSILSAAATVALGTATMSGSNVQLVCNTEERHHLIAISIRWCREIRIHRS